MPVDAIIVGSGIAGLTTGCRLLQTGRSVTILERGEPAREASWAGGGILSPLQPWRYPKPVVELAAWSQARYEAYCAELLTETGVDPEYRRHGMMILEPQDSPGDAWCAASGVGQRLPSADLRAIEPELATDVSSGFWLPDVAQVRNPRLLQALLRRFAQLGGHLQAHTEVLAVTDEGVETGAGRLQAELIIVCAGAWSSRLLPAQQPVEVRPIRGQMVLLRGTPDLIKPVIIRDSTYLIPRRDGRIVVGSTTEDVGFDKSTNDEVRDQLLSIANTLVPSLRGLPVEHHWAGLRPCPPEGLPYVGSLPDSKRIWLNTGHFRNGLVMAPGSAELLVSQIENRPPPIPIAPFQVSAARSLHPA